MSMSMCVIIRSQQEISTHHSDLGSGACQLPAGAGVGTVYVAEKVVEGVEMSFASLDASRAGAA